MIDLRTAFAILFTLIFSYAGLGRDLPVDIHAPLPFVVSSLLFVGYLYLMRTLVRLPFAVVITIRRTRYALLKHGLNRVESLRDGFTRGFLDARRWTVAPLASIDRLTVVGLTLLSTTPYLGLFLVRLGGMLGIIVLLMLYLFRGTFSFLVADGLNKESLGHTMSLPFLDRGGK